MRLVVYVLIFGGAISLIKHVPILRKCSCGEHLFQQECEDNYCQWIQEDDEYHCHDIPCDLRDQFNCVNANQIESLNPEILCYWDNDYGQCKNFNSCLDIRTNNREDCLKFKCYNKYNQFYPTCQRCKRTVESCSHQKTKETCDTHFLYKDGKVDTQCYWQDGFCKELRQLIKCHNIIDDPFQCSLNNCKWNGTCSNTTCQQVFLKTGRCSYIFNQGYLNLCQLSNSQCIPFLKNESSYSYKLCSETDNVYHWNPIKSQCLPCKQDTSILLKITILLLIVMT